VPSYGGQGVASRGREHDSGAAGGALSGAVFALAEQAVEIILEGRGKGVVEVKGGME